jgi:hypothetical protein
MPKRVAFARINRRHHQDVMTFGDRPFQEEMARLAESHEVRATVSSAPEQQEWIAADMSIDPSGTFVSGLIGFTTQESLYTFDDDSFSWRKGQIEGPEAASERTMVPFAVDMRDDRRWIAFATAQRIRPQSFANAFRAALNNAVTTLKLFPTEWEVDLVTAQSTIEEWLEEHPDVVVFARTVRFPNPVRDLSGVHAEMNELAARTKREEFVAAHGGILSLRNSLQLPALLEGVQDGNVDVKIVARGDGGTKPRFNTKLASDEAYIDEYGADYARGMELVLSALTRILHRAT